MNDDLGFVYVGDAMCSWCWGFAPAIEALIEATGLPVQLVNGGLRPGEAAEAMTPGMQTFLEGCWTQVHEASDQPFDHAGLTKPAGWRYDTLNPACAIVTMRRMAPSWELELYHRLQRAFYAQNIDITDPGTWAPLLDGMGVDPDEFRLEATSTAAKKAAWTDFSQARSWGITGFPALLVREGTELSLVTKGWAPTEPLVDAVQAWLAERRPAPEGEACAVGGAC